ncbi:MAG: hypothetical protein WC506_05080 [Candidatus Micrarchaeia archaeon]
MGNAEAIRNLAALFFATLIFAIIPFSFAAALSGPGCTTGGDCIVNASQTIDSGGSYYFNSLVIPQSVSLIIGQSVNDAGGTVRFYVAGDANISGAISANAVYTPGCSDAVPVCGGSNPDGGGYAGGSLTYGIGKGAAGGGLVKIYARRIVFNGTISASGYSGPGVYGEPGGGSGGTVWLVARSISYSGSITVPGGNGADTCDPAGGGAGGSVVILPFEMTPLKSGSLNANCGAGGSACGYTAQSGGGSGLRGGNGQYHSQAPGGGGGSGGEGLGGGSSNGGAANANRNIKIYNSYVPTGSSFSLSSSGGATIGNGLLDLYNSPYSSKYSGLTYTLKSENFIAGAFGASMAPAASVSIKLVNSSNNSQIYYSGSTNSDGIIATTQNLPAFVDFDMLVEPVTAGGAIGLSFGNSSAYPAHSSSSLTPYAQSARILVRKINASLYKPDLSASSTDFYVYSQQQGSSPLNCFGYTSSSQDAYCLLPRTLLDSSRTRLNYSLYVNTSSYSNNINLSQIQLPNSFAFGPSSQDTKLRGESSALLMKAGLVYKRRVFYSPTQLSEENFAYTETIPSDFAFGTSAAAYVSMAGQAVQNCTFSAPSTGKVMTFSSSNCPILATPITSGDWILFQYDIVAPSPDAFFGESKDYSFNQGSLQVSASSS